MDLWSLLLITTCAAVACNGAGSDLELLKNNPDAYCHEGTEFFVAFFDNSIEPRSDSTKAVLYIANSNHYEATVTIEIPKDTTNVFSEFPMTITIAPKTSEMVEFPTSSGSDIRVSSITEMNKGIHIVSNVSVTVIGMNDHTKSADAFLVLPCHKYEGRSNTNNYKYFIFSIGQPTVAGNPVSAQSRLVFIPCEDGLTITFTPSQGTQRTINAQKFDTKLITENFDLTGSTLTATGPLAVFTGHQCGQIPTTVTACDILVEQIPPHVTYGQTFFALPLAVRRSGELYRVGSILDDNDVTVTCTKHKPGGTPEIRTMTANLNSNNKFFEFQTAGGRVARSELLNFQREFCCIETSKPATVMQYTLGHSVDSFTEGDSSEGAIPNDYGDPAISYVPPVTQYKNNYIMTSLKEIRPNFLTYMSFAISSEFFNPTLNDEKNFMVNGATFEPEARNAKGTGGTGKYIPIYCSNNTICGYGAYSEAITGTSVISYNSSREPKAAVYASIYGFEDQVSFMYPAGFELEPIGLPHVSVKNVVVFENEGPVTIEFIRTGGDLSLPTRLFASTRMAQGDPRVVAIEGSDYRDNLRKQVRFRVNQVTPRTDGSKDTPYVIDIINDDIEEDTETFEIFMEIVNFGYAYPNPIGTVTILDDDAPPECSIDPSTYSTSEIDGEVVEIIVTSNNPTKVGTSCRISTISETGANIAEAGTDYTPITDVVAMFAPGAARAIVPITILNDDIVENKETFRVQLTTTNPSVTIVQPNATVEIADFDVITFAFNPVPYTVNEADGNVILNITKIGSIDRAVTINLQTEDGSATSADYTPTTMDLTFLPTENSKTVSVPITNDKLFELDEVFTATISQTPLAPFVLIPQITATASITILNDDKIKFRFIPASYSIGESGGSQELIIEQFCRAPEIEDNVTILFSTVDGTATSLSDFVGITQQPVVFSSGDNFKSVFVSITNDTVFEETEEFKGEIALEGSQDIAEITVPEASVTIIDDDVIEAVVQFDPIIYDVNEGENARLRIVLSEPSNQDVTVEVTTQDGTALAPSDYSSVSRQLVTIPVGVGEAFLEIPTTEDEINEVFEENFTAFLSNPTNAMVGANNVSTIIISDDDLVLVNLNPNTYTVTEGEQVTVTAVLSRIADRPLSVSFSTSDESATAPDDYTSDSRTITFQAGELSAMILLSTAEDQVAEGNEIFKALLQNPTDGLLLGANSDASVEIVDDDMVSINFDPIVYNVTEGMSATLGLVLSTTSTEDVTVDLTTVDGSASAPGDYIASTTMVTFPAGSTTQEVPVQTVGDTIHERAESFIAILSNPVGGELGTDTTATVNIADNDDLFVNFDPTTYSVTEGDLAELMVVLNRPSDHDVTVELTTSDGRATAPGDYTSTSTTITFPAGSTMQTVSVPTVDDDTNEQLEEFSAQLSNPSDELVLGTDSSAQVNIEDNDPLSVQFDPATYSVQEGGRANLVAVLNREADRSVSVSFNTQDGTAEAPGDYSSISGRILEFPAGETSVMIPVDTAQDVIAEGDEGFEAILSNPTNGLELGSQDRAGVTIRDDDVLSINFDPVVYNITEGMSATLRLVLSTTSTEDVTVDLTTVDGSASAPGDYIALTTTVTFPAGSTTQEVPVQTVGDTIHERAESFTAILSNPVGGELGTDTTATVNIADDDDLFVNFDPTTYSVTEGDQAELMVVLNRPSDHDVTVQLTTSDGRATAPGDYTSTTTTITFPAGSTNQTVSVPTVDDDTNEQLEEFSAQLSNPSDELMLGTDSSAQVNIEDNDPLSVQFEPATYSVQEGGRVNLVAVLNRETDRNVSVSFNTQDGTAEAPEDYSSISGRILEFPAGVTSVMIPVDTAQDVIAEGDEGFEAILSNPTNGLELGSQDRAGITIRDDDVISVSFGRTLYPVSEGDVALLEVILSTPSTENISVDIVTMDSSAEAPEDYVRFVTTIEFPAGTTQLELPVPTVEDEVNELGEIFFANLSNPRGGGAMLGRDVDATIEIIDDDPLSISFVPTTYTTDEGEDAVLMIALNRVADRPISVDVSTSENTATDPEDYNSVSTNITFSPGETLVEFPVSTVDDIISELSEDFEATLSNPSPGAMLGNRTALISIADNDDLTVSIEESDYRVPEGAGIVEVCVVLNYEAVEEIRVFGRSKEAVAGEAKDVEDFTAEMFPITFQPGERKKCVSVNITNDEIVEQMEESFVFDIEIQSSHLNPTASRSSSNITIIDDDMLSIRFEEENYIVNETAGTVTVCVERVGRTADPIMVTINAAESSPSDASDGDDFRAGSFEVTIQPNEIKGCVDLPILDDTLAMEGTESFDLTLDTPEGIPSSPPHTSRVSVLDDDVINVSFTTPDVMVQENVSSGSTEVCFMPSTSSAQPYTIEVSHMPTGQFPATFGVDYTVVREDLAIMIPSGSPRERCIPIGIVNDSIALEEPETFIFEFETLPSGVVRGGNPTALVNITEDDVSVMVNFVSEDVEVNENNGSVFVCVERNAVTYVEQTVPIIISVGTADTNDFVKKDTNITFGQLRSMACTEIPVLDDTTQEFPETFAVGFGRVPPGGGIVPGPFSQASITIIDDDDPESSDCRISEPLMVRPFNSSASYNFRGTCELIAVMSCNAIEPSFSVRVDFIGETDSLGNVGIFKDGFAWISGPNGRLTDNAQKIANEDSLGFFYPENDIHFIPNNTEGINQFIIGDSIGVTVIHDYEAGEVSINYMSGSSLQESCGICGTQSGRLRQLDGSTVTSPAQRQGFVESYRPAPDRQYLPQRTECGIVRNDSVIGDPLFTVPVRTENGERRTLCFEVHGESNRTFNLISDTCLNVNAHYSRVDDLNIISSVGIKAEGYNGTCMDIQVNLEGCAVSTSVGGGPTIHLDPSDDLQMDHISLRQYADRVRVSVPNCHRAGVVMWVICERANDRRPVDMIRFHVSRGVNLMPSSHGLLGQFWNVPVSVEKYTSEEDLSDLTDNPSNLYNITVIPADIHRSSARFFLADIFPRTWDNTKEPCLYVGNAQAGPGGEVPDLVDSVIEGKYTHYMVASLFETEFMYEQWKSDCRAPPTSPDSALNYRG